MNAEVVLDTNVLVYAISTALGEAAKAEIAGRLLAAGNVGLFCSSSVKSTVAQWSLMDVGGVIGIAGMSLMLVTSAMKHTAKLYREEKLS